MLEIAKNVIKMPGWKCEWGLGLSSYSECRVVLVSWNTYLKVKQLFFAFFSILEISRHTTCFSE
jgi:hypothetical protein